MKLAVSQASFPSCDLAEAAGVARALGFGAVDLLATGGGGTDGALGSLTVRRVRDLGMTIPNLHWAFGSGFSPAINDPDHPVRARNRDLYRRMIDFCHEAGVLSATVLPGLIHPGQTEEAARGLAVEVFAEYLEIARPSGVSLVTEAHVGSCFDSPDTAANLVGRAAGLGLVLDYSHFICQGYPQRVVDPLSAYAKHVHIRQAKPGALQTRFEDGTINMGALLDRLQQVGYDGYLTIEYVHTDWMQANTVDVLTETVKMRDYVTARIEDAEASPST